MKKLSTAIVMVMWVLLMVLLVSSPLKADWSNPLQLTDNTASDGSPSISGDGSKIAFPSTPTFPLFSDSEIWVINSDGSGLTQLTNNTEYDENPSISGDGSKIAFQSDVGGDEEIWVINSDGTGLQQLTDNTADDEDPFISGDGSKIVFQSGFDWDFEIWVINSDGSGLTQLTNNKEYNICPSISGDGSTIAFLSAETGGDFEIWVVNSDGSGLTQLTNNTAHDDYPCISGDGSKIAYQSSYDHTFEGFEIWVVNSDGSGLTQLTNNTVIDGNPSISGDGSKIAFISYLGGDFEIWVVSLDVAAPVIGEPTQQPEGDVQPDQPVKISVSVTDATSGVENVTLSYTIDNGDSWANLPMTYNATFDVYQATIPGQAESTLVKYKIVAYNNAGNPAVKDNAGEYYIYNVIPEYSSWLLPSLLLTATLVIIKKFFDNQP